jgi:hypothetical protein
MMFFNLIAIILLYLAHIILVYSIRGLKRNIGAGVDFAITSALLSGMWFGPKWGFIIAVIFEITSYIVQMEFFPSLILLIPATGCVAIWASIATSIGIGLMPTVFIGVIAYAIITDIGMYLFFGERDFVMMACYLLGVLTINWIFFDLFF